MRRVVGPWLRPKPLYLVSTAGHPNYGDELITRSWLDYLAKTHPRSPVWLDSPHPGRAAHLFRGAHPHLQVTNTLWELAMGSPSHDPVEDEGRISALILDLGSPRFDAGLLALRDIASLHIVGGGYLNSMWQDNLGLLAAATAVHREFGVRIAVTGLGLLPIDDAHAEWVRSQLAQFDVVEVRDAATSAFCGVPVGLDDAFLAIGMRRALYAQEPTPDRMVLVQGDMRAWSEQAAEHSVLTFTGGNPKAEVGFVEAVAPDDAHYARLRPEATFYPFGRVWNDGLPARARQQWLTTRFHLHLMAAAAGAAGTVILGRPGYYDIKHQSLLDLGTGWNLVEAGADLREEQNRPTADPAFPTLARRLAGRKRDVADGFYRP
ncbi:polysaccharide pyruvyl transferase family protein [Microbacterium sp. NPDC055910]|uniref:polysaccharide pyruvyl transferase family protein n=1 Tax=Microbacterium sp. NPDC055910 TaxID=3345659 RepID=UPI0035D8D1BE